MEKQIEGKIYTVRELTYVEAIEMEELSKTDKIKKMLMLACDISEEDILNLSLKNGVELQQAVNEVNGLTQDFQKPIIEETAN